jgi:hypothetical protein
LIRIELIVYLIRIDRKVLKKALLAEIQRRKVYYRRCKW